MRAIHRSIGRLEFAPPLLFDFPDLFAHHTKSRHVATKLRTRILGQELSFCGAQSAELFIGLV